MAKRRKRARRTRRSASTTLAACQLREVPGAPDFQAVPGVTVEMATRDLVGTVLIAKAEYGGKQLVPPRQAVASILFKVLAGRNTLKAVFVFDASISGRGELRENCGGGDSHFLRLLAGDEPLQIIRIIGTEA